MDFTFGIITDGGKEERINKIIDSIELQKIPNYEIVIVGDCKIDRKRTRVYTFDETIKKSWITRKKNIITYHAEMENIVYLHDYVAFNPGWYAGYQKFGNQFDLCSNIVTDSQGFRWVDWSLLGEDLNFIEEANKNKKFLLPYNEQRLSKFMYFPGNYWVAKKKVMTEFPLNENLIWGLGEDIEWSKRVREKYNFSFNSNSSNKFIKKKGNPFKDTSKEIIEILIENIDNQSFIDMEWTFGICTTAGQEHRVDQIVKSIENLKIKTFEILIIGNYSSKHRTKPFNKNVRIFGFDETIKKGWITKKKNLIAQHAKYSNISIGHDYLQYSTDWYNGFKKFGEDWDACMTKVHRQDGVRYLDWFSWNPKMRYLDYQDHSGTNNQTMYLPGYYFCIKKEFLLQNPLNEELTWGQGEDCDWSYRVNSFWKLKCNSNSTMQLIKANRFFEEDGKLKQGPEGELVWDFR